MSETGPSATVLLQGGINYAELLHWLFAMAAFGCAIAAAVIVYVILKELNKS